MLLPSPHPSSQDLDQPWAFFQLSLQDVRDRLMKEAVADYVEMFKVHGDINSFLYTGMLCQCVHFGGEHFTGELGMQLAGASIEPCGCVFGRPDPGLPPPCRLQAPPQCTPTC